MKKLLVAGLLAGIGYAVYRSYADERDDRELWTAVTDDVD